MKIDAIPLDLATLRARYASGELTPTALVEEVWRRCEAHADPAVWIHRLTRDELLSHARRIEAKGAAGQPLYGVPFAVKDNIDLAGVPTTAGCPEFASTPAESSVVVARLIEAGAIPVGKTNLDQFATGLVGTRSPYGVPRNPFHPEAIPGGSSSGSAVAVASGLAGFALGTDTAGSGRVPAGFNNIVGLKPTRGWLSARGVVPACRTLDCVSVFALTVADAQAVAQIAGVFDPAEPYSREAQARADGADDVAFRFGAPAAKDMEWFGDPMSAPLYEKALRQLEAMGGERVEVDFAPFLAAGRLLYEGPWLAERWVAVRDFHAKHADAMLPVTRRVIEPGAKLKAADAFASFYHLEQLRQDAEKTWPRIDMLVLPTAATVYTRAQVEADPIVLNSRLGHYTNFANLLDCAAVAIPAGFRGDGIPFGITFFGPAWSDPRLAFIGAAFHRATAATVGAGGWAFPVAGAAAPLAAAGAGRQFIAVVGAHLRGQPLNPQLTERGGRWVRTLRTADCYRLYALAGTTPAKPGLVRVAPGAGARIEVEVWSLPTAAWGDFVAAIPPPLGIGTLLLEDGSKAKGFLCEPIALDGAEDITRFGGWLNFLKNPAS